LFAFRVLLIQNIVCIWSAILRTVNGIIRKMLTGLTKSRKKIYLYVHLLQATRPNKTVKAKHKKDVRILNNKTRFTYYMYT